jgi:hypothetical protein
MAATWDKPTGWTTRTSTELRRHSERSNWSMSLRRVSCPPWLFTLSMIQVLLDDDETS